MKLNDKQKAAAARLVSEAQQAQGRLGAFIDACALGLDLDPAEVMFDVAALEFRPRPKAAAAAAPAPIRGAKAKDA